MKNEMKNFKLTLLVAVLFGFLQNANAQELQGVEINGVIWATCNIGARTPEEFGGYFTWEEAKIACPKGWRLPISDELRYFSSIRSSIIWTNIGLSDTNYNTFYLPAAGYGCGKTTINYAGSRGYYWSYNERNSVESEMLFFYYKDYGNEIVSYCSFAYRSYGYSVRCVKE